MPAIHCLNNISAKGTDLLPESYSLTDNLDQAEGILVRSAALHDVEFPESMLAIARAGAGVNNIPLDRCAEEGIVVFNTPGANANAVKELVLCSLFLGSRGIIDGAIWCRDNATDLDIGKSAEKAKKAFAGREIMGKKLGVIGLGAIGALVANAALDLGMEVLGYDPYVSVAAAWRLDSRVQYVANLDDICKSCDYISIHVPAMDSTAGMIGKDQIALMGSDTVFLNFSRDKLVDNEALAAALEAGELGCYITDFAIPALMGVKNAIVLPHLGASTAEAEENCAVMAVNQIVDYIDNGNIKNSVNYPAINMGPVPVAGARVAVLHKAGCPVDTAALGARACASGERGAFAYTLCDLNEALSADALAALEAAEGVIRVRVL